MKFLFSTLKNFLHTTASVAEICQKLTDIGLEVESCLDYSASLVNFTVAQIISVSPHPNSQKLQICLVQTSLQKNPLSIVCGASNARSGIKVAFAPIGSSIPSSGLVLKKAKIAGTESNGMLCSAFELGLGFESDGILEIDQNIAIGTSIAEVFQKNDALIELNITPNRADCLGVYNIAKDLSATNIGELKPLPNNIIQSSLDFDYKINNLANNLCGFIAFRQIINLQNQQSPQWLIDYLTKVGLNSISAVVDCLNYTMHLFNQPMHAYNSANFFGEIQIKLANNDEQFTSLKQTQHTLKNTHLVITNQQKILSLAGIIGGLDSSCTMQTNQVLLEAGSFLPENIATTSRELNIISDSKYRFERGIDSSFCCFALDFATNLILQICGGKATKIASSGQISKVKTIDFDYNLVKKLTNLDISPQEITNIFTKLGFIVENTVQNQNDNKKITVPSNRFDINLPCDLVEEITRIYGYNQIPIAPLPNSFSTLNITNNTLDFAYDLVRKNLVSCGFIETINWSFTSLKIASCFTKPEQLLELHNPISAEMQYLRPTLLTGLIANYKKNSAYSFFDCSLFEIGNVFANQQNQTSIALLQAGNNISDNHLQPPRVFNVFDIKQNLLNMLEIFNLKPESLQLQNQNLPSYYHPHRSMTIFLGKKLLGYFGEIHPNINQYFGLKNRLNVAEIFCQNLPEVNFNINHKAYQHNLLPTVERDFSFIAEGYFIIGDILKTITNTDKIYINQVILLDIFAGGKNLTNHQTSLTFRVKIKPTIQTLTTSEIDSISQKIINNLSSNHQLTLRQF